MEEKDSYQLALPYKLASLILAALHSQCLIRWACKVHLVMALAICGVSCTEAQDYIYEGKCVDKSLKPVPDVELLLVVEPFPWLPLDAPVKILDRSRSDALGHFDFKIPLNTDWRTGTPVVVQLPHQNFAAIKEELDIGFRELGVILKPNDRYFFQVHKRSSISLAIQDETGNPIEGAKVAVLGGWSSRYLDAIPELSIPASNQQGRIDIDTFILSENTAISVSHPDFAMHRFLCGKQSNNETSRIGEVTLKKGVPLEVLANDYRIEDKESEIRIRLHDRSHALQPNTPTIVHLDWRNIDEESSWLLKNADSNFCLDFSRRIPFVLRPSHTNLEISICNTGTLRGFVRDRMTGRPLHGRGVAVSTVDYNFSNGTPVYTQHDGYFETPVPKILRELKVRVLSCDGGKDETTLIIPGNDFSKPIIIEASSPESCRINVSASEAENDFIVFQTETRYAIARDGWFEFDSNGRDFTSGSAFSMKRPMAGNVIQGQKSISMDQEVFAIGRLRFNSGEPAAWSEASVKSSSKNIGDRLIYRKFPTTSQGRFVFSGLPKQNTFQLAPNFVGTVIGEFDVDDEAVDLGEIIVDEFRYNKVSPSFHVDEWIHGTPFVPKSTPDRPLLILTEGQYHSVGQLHLLRSIYSDEELDIVYIIGPNGTEAEAIKTELLTRNCTFSVGIDRQLRTVTMLPRSAMLFLQSSNEAVSVEKLDLRTIRDAMLYLNKK